MNSPLLSMTTVIFTRFSSDLQSNKSCKDQEREVRDALSRMGIDHSNAVVIYDEAESGTKVYRNEFARLQSIVDSGQPVLLAVDDQARLSRADNTFGFITDLVYTGGRFISTGEGIDTEQTGWELRVKVMELHNSTTIRELGRRVRRGQLGRVLSRLSTGDFCFGYESYVVNPAQQNRTRGPKPERGIRIDEAEAIWIRKIFEWFISGRSIAWIAEKLNRCSAPTGHRRRSGRWQERHVRKVLGNKKYVGTWQWGTTRTIRNSQGKKKQITVPEELHVVVERPELSIVDEELWKKAQQRLIELKAIYGSKPGQKRRGPKEHHTALYPSDLLSGLVTCEVCGSRMWKQSSGPRKYLGCPNRGKAACSCNMSTRVPVAIAEKKVLETVKMILVSSPDWLNIAYQQMNQQIEDTSRQIPDQLKQWRQQMRELESEIENLVEALARSKESIALVSRLDAAEIELSDLIRKIDEAEIILDAPIEFPHRDWFDRQLTELASVILEGGYEAWQLLRQVVKRIEAGQVIPPGKSRGYSQLTLCFAPDNVLLTVLEESGGTESLKNTFANLSTDGDEVRLTIDLGEPTPMDQWAPEIVRLRQKGKKWKDITEITGLDLNRVYIAWKRYVKAMAD